MARLYSVVGVLGMMGMIACIEPPAEVACGALTCPATDVCLADGTCTTAEDAAACAGLPDGMTCTTPAFQGVCRVGACRAATCGDGFVDGSEQCDGSVNVDCVDYGFDLGVPTCSNCVIDLATTCVRFGWVQVATATASAAWTDGTRIGAITRAQDALEIYDVASGQLVARTPGRFFQVTGDAQRIIAWADEPNVMVQWDGASFTTVDLGAIAGSLEWAVLDNSDVMWIVSVTTGCTLYALTPSGTLTAITTPSGNVECAALYAGDGQVLLGINEVPPTVFGSEVLRVNGTVLDPVFSFGPTSNLVGLTSHDGVIYASSNNPQEEGVRLRRHDADEPRRRTPERWCRSTPASTSAVAAATSCIASRATTSKRSMRPSSAS